MKAGLFRQLSGLVVLIGFGLMLIVLIIEVMSESDLDGSLVEKVIPIMGLPFAVSLIGLWRSLDLEKLGKAGLIIAISAALLLFAGAALMIVFQLDAGWMIFVIAMMLMSLGLLLLGIEVKRGSYFGSWSFTPLAAGIIAGPLAIAETVAAETLDIFRFSDGDLGFILWFVSGAGFFLYSGV